MVIDSDPQQQMHRYESSVMDIMTSPLQVLATAIFTVQLSVNPAIGHPVAPETQQLI